MFSLSYDEACWYQEEQTEESAADAVGLVGNRHAYGA